MSTQIQIQYFKTPVGEMILGAYEQQLCLADWRYRKMRHAVDQRLQKGLSAAYVEADDELLQKTREQLNAYFAGERSEFELPLLFVGTDFQQKVWHTLLQVPYGQTATYLQLAEKHGDVKAIRAVASANGANAISIIVPCHRIIGSSGELVGYAGGLPAKQKLLALEQAKAPQSMRGQLQLEF
jgi:methylated-DNA-[protein]-cysteine S-methyltransferase